MPPRPAANSLKVSEVFHEARADYDAMRTSQFVRQRQGLAPMGGGADYHIRNESAYFRLVEAARDASRNDSIIGKTIERAALNVVQNGFTLCPETGDSGLDTALFDRWLDWSTDPEQCDVAGEYSLVEQLQLATEATLTDGDIIGLGTREGQIQLIESHLVRNPRKKDPERPTVIGVELNEYRRRVAYHVRNESLDPLRSSFAQAGTRYETRNAAGERQVFHMLIPRRTTATRGVTALAPVFYLEQMFEDVTFAKVVQSQVVSCFAIWRYREASDTPSSNLEATVAQTGARERERQSDGSERSIDQLGAGAEIATRDGEKIEGFSPDVPNPTYFDHAKMIMSLIGINLGMPFVMMFMDASETNFSGWRAAVEEARRGFRRIPGALVDAWLQPYTSFKLRQFAADDQALAKALADNPRLAMKHVFRPPAWPYVSPTEDAAAGLLRVRNTLTSARPYHGEQSQDWEEIATESVADNAFAISAAAKKAAEMNLQHAGVDGWTPITWREVLSLPTPDGIQVSLSPATNQAATAPRTGGTTNAG